MLRLTFVFLLAACSRQTAETAVAEPPSFRLVTNAELDALALEFDYELAFAAWEEGASEGVCVGECATRRPPASTFKVPHALIALETGVLSGPDHVIEWDGVRHGITSWNQDQTLTTAIQRSALWYFQSVAPEIGEARMQTALDQYEYGNRTIGDAIDQFWIDGSLTISPEEQVRFWHRLHDDAFGADPRHRQQILMMTELAREGDVVLRAKTGWDRRPHAINHGWLTGCVDGQARVCFATMIRAGDPFDHAEFRAARFEISRAMLEALGHRVPRID